MIRFTTILCQIYSWTLHVQPVNIMCEPKQNSTRYVLEEICVRDASNVFWLFSQTCQNLYIEMSVFFFFIWHEPLQRLYVEFNDAAIAQNTFEAILLE